MRSSLFHPRSRMNRANIPLAEWRNVSKRTLVPFDRGSTH